MPSAPGVAGVRVWEVYVTGTGATQGTATDTRPRPYQTGARKVGWQGGVCATGNGIFIHAEGEREAPNVDSGTVTLEQRERCRSLQRGMLSDHDD